MQNKPLIKIAPSMLSADFGHLATEARRCEEAGADFLHLDVMDGQFVPNLSMGPQIVAAVNRATDLFLDVHLMIYNPFDYIERFVEAGADCITFHFEATEDVEETLNYIKKCGVRCGLAFNPETSASLIPKYLDKCDKILLMTVNPGFGGQDLIEDVLEKVSFTRDLCQRFDITSTTEKGSEQKVPFDIQIDGGVSIDNIKECAKSGANLFVAGSSLFRAPNMKEAIQQMRKTASESI